MCLAIVEKHAVHGAAAALLAMMIMSFVWYGITEGLESGIVITPLEAGLRPCRRLGRRGRRFGFGRRQRAGVLRTMQRPSHAESRHRPDLFTSSCSGRPPDLASARRRAAGGVDLAGWRMHSARTGRAQRLLDSSAGAAIGDARCRRSHRQYIGRRRPGGQPTPDVEYLTDADVMSVSAAVIARRMSLLARYIMILLIGIGWIAACAAPCIGQASNPGPWQAPVVPVDCAGRRAGDFDDPEHADFDVIDDDPHAFGGSLAGWSTAPPSLCDGDDLGMVSDDWHDADCGDYDYDDGGMNDVGDTDFIPSESFAGAKGGMAFKLGPRGIGYYRDAPRQDVGVQRVTLCLHDLVQHPSPAPAAPERELHHGEDGGDDGRRGTAARRGRRKRAKRRTAVATYSIPQEADAEDSGWKAAGLWTVDTANPNAWGGAMRYLEMTAADAVLVQEVRRRGHQVQGAEREAERAGWKASIREAEATEANGITAGLAIAVRKHLGLSRLGGGGAECDDDLSARVHVRWMGGVVRGGLHLLTAWPHHTEGATERNIDILDRLARAIDSVKGPWLVGADWNITPEALLATGWLDLVDGVVVAPMGATCNSSCIDYFVVSRSFVHAVQGVSLISNADFHPHKAVRIYLKADARALQVRRLKAPRAFPANAGPPGCHPRAATLPAAGGGEATDARGGYRAWLDAVERDLCEVHGLGEGKERLRYVGRAAGPRYVWESPLGRTRASPRYSSAASRRWRTVARCAHDIAAFGSLRDEGKPTSTTLLRTTVKARQRLGTIAADFAGVDDVANAAAALLATTSTEAVKELEGCARQAAEREERRLAKVRADDWDEWIRGGPAGGLGRQHRFSRVQAGWVPSKVGLPERRSEAAVSGGCGETDRADIDDEPQVGRETVDRVLRQTEHGMRPLNVQDVVEDQARVWADFWAAGENLPEPAWPKNVDDLALPRPTVGQLRCALKSFSSGTALGWEALHPRALLGLSDQRLEELIDLLMSAERSGAWPEGTGTVLIVLLPKPDGGWRPIGLFPTIIRVWMKLRRQLAQGWEEQHSRDFLFAGRGKGAHVAAWQHAQRAEQAADAGATFVQLLLDMQKCFELVPHDVLVQEARAVGYPLPLLRLALAAYRLPRSLSIGGVHSSLILAERGIAAGSGLATTELRVLLIRLLDRVRERYPAVKLSAYVDDLTADASGTQRTAPQMIVDAGSMLCRGIVALGLKLSIGKCKVLATSASAGRQATEGLGEWKVKLAGQAKMLGAGVSAGARRAAGAQKTRWANLLSRLHRLAILIRQKISVARLLRTGISSSFTYGDEVVGVATATLEARRRTVASLVGGGAGGKSIDMVLALADERQHQRLDPAFDAHILPIGRWAEAAWCDWASTRAMDASVALAKKRLAKARRPWSAVNGPAAAMVATAARLNWTVVDAVTLISDTGRRLELRRDPPCVVKREVHGAVRRWRWRRICLTNGYPFGKSDDGGEVCLDVFRRLLSPRARGATWTAAHQSALKSALVNGQWCQQRLFSASMADDPFCKLCQRCGVARGDAVGGPVCAEPPTGTLYHRLAECVIAAAAHDHHGEGGVEERHRVAAIIKEACDRADADDQDIIARDKAELANLLCTERLRATPRRSGGPRRAGGRMANPTWLQAIGLHAVTQMLDGVTMSQWGKAWDDVRSAAGRVAAWSRAVVPAPCVDEGADERRRIPDEGTFHWSEAPPPGEMQLCATFYADGSAFEGRDRGMRRLGWSFVAVGSDGQVLAAASGVPPPWVDSVAAAEAWALVQAASTALPGSTFKTDCQAVLKAVRSGRAKATAHDRPLARVMGILLAQFDGPDEVANLVWLPGHSSKADVGRAELSDGSRLTVTDLVSNARADRLAKAAAAAWRLPPQQRAAVAAHRVLVHRLAMHIGRVTWAANHAGDPPMRDSDPIPRKARTSRGPRCVAERAPALGGHVVATREGGGWSCVVCKRYSVNKSKFSAARCSGDAFSRWAQKEAALTDGEQRVSSSHVLRLTGQVAWCATCGDYATERAVGLAAPCRGRPPRGSQWGRHTKLSRLRNGLHPKTGEPLAECTLPAPRDIIAMADEATSVANANGLRGEVGLPPLPRPRPLRDPAAGDAHDGRDERGDVREGDELNGHGVQNLARDDDADHGHDGDDDVRGGAVLDGRGGHDARRQARVPIAVARRAAVSDRLEALRQRVQRRTAEQAGLHAPGTRRGDAEASTADRCTDVHMSLAGAELPQVDASLKRGGEFANVGEEMPKRACRRLPGGASSAADESLPEPSPSQTVDAGRNHRGHGCPEEDNRGGQSSMAEAAMREDFRGMLVKKRRLKMDGSWSWSNGGDQSGHSAQPRPNHGAPQNDIEWTRSGRWSATRSLDVGGPSRGTAVDALSRLVGRGP